MANDEHSGDGRVRKYWTLEARQFVLLERTARSDPPGLPVAGHVPIRILNVR